MVTMLAADARSLFHDAEREARAHRSDVVEAVHLLLAMSAQPGTAAGGVLASAGLTHDTIELALDREFEASLAAAGLSVNVSALKGASPEPPRRLRLSTSFKVALERSVTVAAGSGQIRTTHLLLGILEAEVGTIPRTLHYAGVDRTALATLVRQAPSG